MNLFFAARLYLLIVPHVIYYSGAAMNQAVFVANNGKFPVMINDRAAKAFKFESDGMNDDRHTRMTKHTKLNWLADYINFGNEIDSPGDLMIDLGQFLAKFSLVVWMTLVIADRQQLCRA